jgi:hypothetical protein
MFGDGDVADEDFGWAIGDAVVVFVFEDGEVHSGEDTSVGGDDSVKDVKFIAEGDYAARVVYGGENSVFLGNSVIVGIDEANDTSFSWAFSEGAEEVHTDVDFARGRCGDASGGGSEITTGEFAVGEVGRVCGYG